MNERVKKAGRPPSRSKEQVGLAKNTSIRWSPEIQKQLRTLAAYEGISMVAFLEKIIAVKWQEHLQALQ